MSDAWIHTSIPGGESEGTLTWGVFEESLGKGLLTKAWADYKRPKRNGKFLRSKQGRETLLFAGLKRLGRGAQVLGGGCLTGAISGGLFKPQTDGERAGKGILPFLLSPALP